MVFVAKVVAIWISFLFFSFSISYAATVTWSRPSPAASPNWSVGTNWSGGVAPGASDDVVFDGTSVLNSLIDANRVVNSLTITSAYTGVITHNYNAVSNISLQVASDYDQRGGAYVISNSAVSSSYYPFSVGGSFFVTSEAVFSRYEVSGGYYLVSDVYGLQAMGCSREAGYKLNSDIDASPTADWNYSVSRSTYEGFVPICADTFEAFTGSLEGNYKTITGLHIERYDDNYVGMFGALGAGAVVNGLSLTGARITGWNAYNLAGLAAHSLADISNCYVDARISAYGAIGYVQSTWQVGMIAAVNGGSISQSYSSGNIITDRRSQWVPYMYAGGIASYNSSDISNCYSAADISNLSNDDLWLGGLVGYNAGDVSYSYASGAISKSGTKLGVGGLVGYNASGATAVGSYFSQSGYDNTIGQLITPQEMSRESSFSGWNFGTVWSIDPNHSYPYFIWSVYNWIGDGIWADPANWNKNSGYPSLESHKAYINSAPYDINTPSGQPLTIGGIKLGSDLQVKVTLGNDITLSSSAGKSGSLILYGGTFEVNGKTLSIQGDLVVSQESKFYSNTAVATGSGTVEFAGSGHSFVQGDTRFHNLRVTEPYKRITFEAGSIHTVEGTLYLSGEAGREIMLSSSVPGQQWYISPESTVAANHLIVADSCNQGATITADNSYDGGNNSGWSFGGYTVTVLTNEGGSISPSGILGEVFYGTGPATFEVASQEGYYIGFVRIDGTFEAGPYSSPHRVEVPGIGHHSVEAYFVQDGIKIWHGEGGDGDWSNADNWTGYTIPGDGDSVVFNSISDDSTVNSSFTIQNLTIEADYPGTITHSSHLTIEGDFVQNGGTFESDPAALLDVNGSFSIPDVESAFTRFTGSGSEIYPYLIYDVYGLQAVRCNLDKYFRLNNTVDASATRNWNWNGTTHEGFKPIGYMAAGTVYDVPDHPFTGLFNGGSNKISGLFINRADSICIGLFGASISTHTKAIYNLAVSDAYVSGYQIVGGLVGYNSSNIYDCYFAGEAYCENYQGIIGGFVGAHMTRTIGRCYVNATVDKITDRPHNIINAGLFVGTNQGLITNCFSEGVIYGNFYVGGFAGFNGATISNCYTTGFLEASTGGGGFLGNGGGPVSSCYYTQEKGPNFNSYANHITLEQLKDKDTFSGWDLDSVWSIDEGVSGPSLLWEYFNWTGNAGTTDWDTPGNWSKNLEAVSDPPQTFSDNVFLNDSSSDLSTPSDAPLQLGELVLGSTFLGKLTFGNNITISSESSSKGNLVMCQGTIEASNSTISIEGNFRILSYGSPYFLFSSEASTVEVFGKQKDSLIQMSYPVTKHNDFYNFRCITPGKVLTFYSGPSYYSKVKGSLLISGEAGAGNLVVLQGTSASPSAWYVSPEGTVSVTNVIVSNSYNLGADIITAEGFSYDGGNNTRWDLTSFIGNPITAIAGSGGTISPEGIIPVAFGETTEFIVSSAEGYYIGFVKIDGIPTDESLSAPEVRFYLTADGNPHSIEAYFSGTNTRTWTGGALDEYWSSPCNWTGNTTPQANERVIFNQTSSKNSKIDSFNLNNTIYAISIESMSTAFISQEASLTVATTYEQSAGRFYCNDPVAYSLTIGGDFIIPDTFSYLTPPFRRMAGWGTIGDPFLIVDIYGLQGVVGSRKQSLYSYKLADNIDASPTRRWNWNGATHEGFCPIGDTTYTFDGVFNGDYRVITGLWINRPLLDKVGLFGQSNGIIQNVGIEDSEVIGHESVGGLVGWLQYRVINCYFDGFVSGETIVGGLVGTNFGGSGLVRSSFSKGVVKANSNAGGLVGSNNFYSKLYDSYSTASVEVRGNQAGGLASWGEYIYNCYAVGPVAGESSLGGLFGAYGSPIENSFFIDTLLDNGGGTLTSEANMKKRKNFTDAGWDFGRTWSIDETRSYPYFQWEKWLWTGAGNGSSWTDVENWNKHSSYPLDNSAKVYIGTSDATISTPLDLPITLGGLQLSSDFTGNFDLGNNLILDSSGADDYEGGLYIYGGTMDASSQTITIDGNYYKSSSGTFSREGSTVVFADAAYPSLIEGRSRFNNFSCTTPGKKLSFEAGSRQTVEGTFTITGTDGNQVFLRSSRRGVTWEIYPVNAGGASVSYAIVQDSKNVSSSAITAGNSIDYGNNINWTFYNYAIEVFAGSNGYVNTMEGSFYLSTAEYGTIALLVSPESPSYYISDVKIDGRSTTESIYHPGTPHSFILSNIQRFYTFEAVFRSVGAKEWDGGGSTNNWSNPLNWAGNSTPEPTDIAKFNSLSTKNATIDASFAGTVAGVSIESGYTGTIRQNRGLTVNGSFEQNGGYFICTTPTTTAFTVTGNFSLPDANGSFIRYNGTGSLSATSYVIHDIYGLQAVKCNLGSYFKLYDDIDASASRYWNWNASTGTYEGFIPIGSTNTPFTGSFSGESFVVSNLWIDRNGKGTPLGDNTGLFGVVGTAAFVHRFGIRDSHIRGFSISGALVGANYGVISQCLVSGGLVEGGLDVVGGVVGGNSGTMEDSYSTANVTGWNSYAGVFGGYNLNGHISRCYAAGTLRQNGEGFIGDGTDDDLISNCYYSTYESGRTGPNHGALPLTPVEMKHQASFETWNFDTVWTIDESKSYPSLLWEEWVWTGLGNSFDWTQSLNWNKKSGYPSDNTDKVYIDSGTGSINVPSDLSIGSLILGPNYSGALTLLGNLYLGNNGPREGSFLMLGGTLFSAYQVAMVIEGRFKRTSGTLTSNSTIVFTGSGPSIIEGSTTFYNFYCTKESKSLVFEAGSVQTIEGTLRLSSEAGTGGRISLSSIDEDSNWYIHPGGVKEPVYFVDVQDSVNLSPEAINPFYSVNSGNNVNWFDTYYITAESSKTGPLDSETNWGTIEPYGITSFDHGASQYFTATPRFDVGYKLASVMVDGVSLEGVSEDSPYTYTFEVVTADHSIEAVFEIRPFLITAEVSGIGSGTIEPYGIVEVGHNQRQIFTIEADSGNYLAYVRVDGLVTTEGLEDPSYYPSPYLMTFEGTSSDHTLEAHFLPENYYIWSGLGTTKNWSEAANWTGRVTPGADSTVIFNSFSTKNATIDADFSGTVKNISMEAGYTGYIEVGRIFTVEAGVSIESGVLFQTTHEVYVGGDWFCSGEAASFTSEAGAVIFTKAEGVQYVYTGYTNFLAEAPHNFFYDLIHTGAGKVSVRDTGLTVANDFSNMSGSGTFELYGVPMVLGGDFTNSSVFTQEIVSLDLGNLLIAFGGDGTQIIDMGGTGEGHMLAVVYHLSDSTILLAGSLETYGIYNLAGSFDAAGFDMYVSLLVQNANGDADFIKDVGVFHITGNPDFLKAEFDDNDIFLFSGPVSLKNVECSVNSKYIMFGDIIDGGTGELTLPAILTIEADGYATFEGGTASTLEAIWLFGNEDNISPQWVIDPRPGAGRNFRNLFVTDSYNIDSTSIEATNSVGDNTTGWVFDRYVLIATQNSGGTVEPPGMILPAANSTVTYEVRADSGHFIGYILKDGSHVTSEGSYGNQYAVTFEAISENHTIEVYFDRVGGRTWTGGGITENWSEDANWSGNQVPLSTEEAVFNSENVKSAVIDNAFGGTVGGISIESGYTGTITQSRSLLVTGEYAQAGGSFISPVNYAFTVEGSFNIPDTAGAFTRFGGSSPYIIYDIYGLQAMKCYKSASFELNSDINAGSTAAWNLSGASYQGFDPVGDGSEDFGGSLNGRGFVISGLYIDRDEDNIGLFGVLTGEVTQVGISSASVEGSGNVGILAGTNAGSISKAYAKGYAKGSGADIGVAVGENTGTITYSYSIGTVEGGTIVGGFVGNISSGTVTESYADVTEVSLDGGFAGASNGTVTRCHFTGTDNLIGSQESASEIKQKSRFTDWDFDRTWTIDGGKTSPQLMWEIYTWTGSDESSPTDWTKPNNWNKKSGYPSAKEHKAFINSESLDILMIPASLGGLQLGPDYAGTLTLATNIFLDNSGTREGSLILSGGTLNRDNDNVRISGNFKKSSGATYAGTTGDTIFTSEAASIIEGSTTFTNLVCNVPGKSLSFEAGTIQTIEGTLTISGEAGRWVTLESTVAGEHFMISAAATSIYFVSVKDSTNESTSVIDPSGSNLNLGNTSRWFTYYIYATAEPHATIAPEGLRQVVITSSDPITYTITTEVDSGYYLASVEVDGETVETSGNVYTFEAVSAYHTIEVFVTTTLIPTQSARALRVNIDGNNVILSWESVERAAYYKIYRSSNKFATIVSGWTSADATTFLTWTDTNATISTTGEYYIVRGVNAGGEGPNSSMGAYKNIDLTYNAGDTNDNVIGLPYTTSLQKASDIVTSIEGGTGPGTNQYISSIGIWNSSSQNYYTAYQYIDGIGWLGDGDAALNSGTGILLLITGNKAWTPGLVIPSRE